MKNFNLKKSLISSCVLAGLIGITTQTYAQSTSLTDFESATKGNYNFAEMVVNGNTWAISGAMISGDDRDIKEGTKAARFRYTDTLESSMALVSEIPDIQSFSFLYSRSNFSLDREGIAPKIVVFAGVGGAWTSLDTINLDGINELTAASYDELPAGTNRVKFLALAGESGKRFNIDNITINYDGTIAPPTIDTVTTLAESFSACEGSVIGSFTQTSVEGSDSWHCHNDGFGGSPYAARINGGNAEGGRDNEDWLISSAALDFSAMTNPELSFKNKKQYEGSATIKVKISTNYIGSGDPSAATWTDIHTVSGLGDDYSNVAVNINAYKGTPFFLAYVYESSSASNAFAYFLDEVKVANASSTSISNDQLNNQNLVVLGQPNSNNLSIRYTSANAGNHQVLIYDMNGRAIYNQNHLIQNGTNDIHVNKVSLTSGMYVVKVVNMQNGQSATVKAIVK